MDALVRERAYLAEQLTALERCAYFAMLIAAKIDWPLTAEALRAHRLDGDYFEPLAVLNERFAKLQDVLGSTMRHVAFMLAEPTPTFLNVLVFFEKHQVVASVAQWHRVRKMRNDAAHDYDLDPAATAAHFNQIHEELPELVQTAVRLVAFCQHSQYSTELLKLMGSGSNGANLSDLPKWIKDLQHLQSSRNALAEAISARLRVVWALKSFGVAMPGLPK